MFITAGLLDAILWSLRLEMASISLVALSKPIASLMEGSDLSLSST